MVFGRSYREEHSGRNCAGQDISRKLRRYSYILIGTALSHTYLVLCITHASCHQSMTSALYNLAAYPEYVAPLRAEVEQVTTSDGWTKAAIDKMWKVDSFLRESQRSKTIARCELIQPPDCLL